jgi:lysophospholipase L1-like esterase
MPSLILIAAGTNDVWFQNKRPHVFESSDTSLQTLKGVVNFDCMLLRLLCPQAQIILITPMQTIQADTADIHRAGDIIEARGQYFHIPVIRLDYHSDVKSQNEQQAFKYTYDGTHTSELGARSNGYYIAQQVRAIIEQSKHE